MNDAKIKITLFSVRDIIETSGEMEIWTNGVTLNYAIDYGYCCVDDMGAGSNKIVIPLDDQQYYKIDNNYEYSIFGDMRIFTEEISKTKPSNPSGSPLFHYSEDIEEILSWLQNLS